MSDMNLVTRLDSYFTNFTMPWEKKNPNKQNDAVSTVGALQHYKIVEQGPGKENHWQSTPTWAKTYGSQTNILHWCDE
jgi:hypothetical protein